MRQFYSEILAAFQEPPRWYSWEGYPRWVDFHPRHVDDIYAYMVALCRIACQNCGHEFFVAQSANIMDKYHVEETCGDDLAFCIGEGVRRIAYGDPPNVQCCASGPTMNSVMLEVVEFWERDNVGAEWHRDPELEVKFKQEVEDVTEGPELRAD